MTEAELIDALVSALPAAHRASMKAVLESDKLVQVGGPMNSTAQALLAEFARRRQERVNLTFPPRAAGSSKRPPTASTHVFIALSDEAPTATTPKVFVLRSPTDGGVPTVLVRRDATALELDLGVQSAAASVLRSGPNVPHEIRIDIPDQAHDSDLAPKFAVAFLEKLKNNSLRLTERQVGAFGSMRGTTVVARLPQGGRPPPTMR